MSGQRKIEFEEYCRTNGREDDEVSVWKLPELSILSSTASGKKI